MAIERKYLEIYGNDWPTYDGTGVRDYIHIMDLANAHLSALDYCFNQSKMHLSLNIGTGKGISVLDLVRNFEKINKIEIPIRFMERRKGDVPILVADNKLACEKLDWYPKKSIHQMCSDGWLWHFKNQNRFY